MADYWAVEAVGDDFENAGDSHKLGVFVAHDETEAANIALLNVAFPYGGAWRIVSHRIPSPALWAALWAAHA